MGEGYYNMVNGCRTWRTNAYTRVYNNLRSTYTSKLDSVRIYKDNEQKKEDQKETEPGIYRYVLYDYSYNNGPRNRYTIP